MGRENTPVWDLRNKRWVTRDHVNGPIVRSDSPSAISATGSAPVYGQDVARRKSNEADYADSEKGKDVDWMAMLTAGGGGLLAHELAKMFTEKTEEEEKKESIWSKLLRKSVRLGAFAAGAYGGYRLGKKADDATQDGSVYADLFGEKNDAASTYKWPWFGLSAASGYGGIQSARYGARRTGEWLRGGVPKQVVGKDGVTVAQLPENSLRIRALRDEISKIESGIATDAANQASHADALRRIADENAQSRAEHAADTKARRIAYDADMQRYYREQAAYNTQRKAWESAGRKGKPPKAPTMPKTPTFKDFVPVKAPTPPPASGYTQANLATAKSGLKNALGRRAAGGWGGAIASFLTSYLTGRQGYKNMQEESRVDGQLRAAGIDPDTVLIGK